MYCPKCGKEIPDDAVVCIGCGRSVATQAASAEVDPATARAVREFADKKVAAGVCGILLGSLGVHKFILGLTTQGIVMLLLSLLTCGIGAPVMHVIGLVEGITYLTKSDQEFYETYKVRQKGWF